MYTEAEWSESLAAAENLLRAVASCPESAPVIESLLKAFGTVTTLVETLRPWERSDLEQIFDRLWLALNEARKQMAELVARFGQ